MFNNGFTGIKRKTTTIKINYKNIIMKYRVHRLKVQSEKYAGKIRTVLNKLDEEVIR